MNLHSVKLLFPKNSLATNFNIFAYFSYTESRGNRTLLIEFAVLKQKPSVTRLEGNSSVEGDRLRIIGPTIARRRIRLAIISQIEPEV